MKKIFVALGLFAVLAIGGVYGAGTAMAATNVCGNTVNVGTSGHPASGQTCVNGQVKGNTGNGSILTWFSHWHL